MQGGRILVSGKVFLRRSKIQKLEHQFLSARKCKQIISLKLTIEKY
jgi:hypothetical protein